MSKNRIGNRVREKIQESIDQAAVEKKKLLFRKRIELARQALGSFQQKKVTQAVEAFHSYIKILEEWKNVPEGGLTPSLFDREKDAAELLLISGVYWDLAKLYDRTQSKERYREFSHYLEKYVLFSKGMPYEVLCAESLRKYVWNEKPIHKAEFKAAYKKLSGNSCFIATELSSELNPGTIGSLRHFRDEVLLETPMGQRAVSAYYRMGPLAARVLRSSPRWVRRGISGVLDRVAKKLD